MLSDKIKKVKKQNKKFIIVTGGVISGLGKGISSASIAVLLGKKKVVPIKCDGYLNVDPGTMNPVEHGEVFVLDDGGEVDMDFGHYERFIGVNAKKEWNLTMGKVYQGIIEDERKGLYLGKTVQTIPHVTNYIKEKIYDISLKENSDVSIIEIGGTVGDIENELYIEASRQLKEDLGKDNVVYVHLAYVPVPECVKEQKSKPAQQSVKLLNERGIWPDIIIARCEKPINDNIRRKISLFTNVPEKSVISGHDVSSVYDVPISYEEQGFKEVLEDLFNEKFELNLSEWKKRVDNLNEVNKSTRSINIAICGKYTALNDSYASIIESLSHVSAELGIKVNALCVDTEVDTNIEKYDGIIVPGGFGTRGIEGKIEIIRKAREKNIPFLGICYGLQLAVIEYAKNVLGIIDATTAEIDEKGDKKIIDIMPEQKEIYNKGGTMRLGLYEAVLKEGSFVENIYGSKRAQERHRHRYEVNPEYHGILDDDNLILSGMSPDKRLVEFIEMKNHPFFIATQSHPELKSSLLKPAPLFLHLVKACIKNKSIELKAQNK
ncbi:MAG: glutamine hydrolyzing CTP synthase [Nanobdellota archaeon]